MPKLIDIPGVGEIEFPDDMDDASIASEAGRLSMEATSAGDSWSDLPGNILPSVGRLIGGAVSGVASLPGLALDLMDPRPIHNQTQMAVGKALSQPVETAKAIGSAVGDKYGSGAALKHSLITDPAGVAADVSVLLGGAGGLLRGAGAVSKVPGLVRAGEAVGRAGQVVDPLRGVASAVAAGGQAIRPTTATLQDWGTKWMKSAMKVSKTIQDSNVDDVAKNAAELKIMPTEAGFRKAAEQAKGLKKDANALARAARKEGRNLDPARITHRMDREVQRVGAGDPTPGPYQAALRNTRDEFWERNSRPTLVEQPMVSPVRTTTGSGVPQPAGGPLAATQPMPAPSIASRTGTGWGAEAPQSAVVRPLEAPASTTTGMVPVAPGAAEAPILRGVTSDTGFPVRPQTTEVHRMVEGPREGVPISPRRSMSFTERLNKRIPFAKKNGMSMQGPLTPSNEADDALRKAIKIERERVVPGFDAINAERGKRLAIMKQLQNFTLRREGNLDPIPARALLGSGMATGLALSGAPVGAVAGGTIMPWLVNSLPTKGRMAIGLYHGDALLNNAGRAMRTGATATTQAAVGSDLMRQALLDAMTRSTETP